MEFAKSICIKRRSIYLFMNTHKELHVSILSISLPLLCTTSLLYYSHSWESHIWSYTSFELSSFPLPCISLHSLSHSTITTIHPWLRLINIPGWKVFASLAALTSSLRMQQQIIIQLRLIEWCDSTVGVANHRNHQKDAPQPSANISLFIFWLCFHIMPSPEQEQELESLSETLTAMQ